MFKASLFKPSVFLPAAGVLLAVGLSFPERAEARTWVVSGGDSSISFSGQHVGNTFNGRFASWLANIEFDPIKPEMSKVMVTIDLASATTGNAMYDKTLKTADWFDVAKTPQARFVTTSISRGGAHAYVADGQLTIRGKTVPVKMPFTLVITGNTATMHGKVTLNRTDWGIGSGSDPKGEWVSLSIPVQVKVTATAKEPGRPLKP